jgi:hypothetical protein
MIVVSCAIGAYAIQNAMFDIWLMLGSRHGLGVGIAFGAAAARLVHDDDRLLDQLIFGDDVLNCTGKIVRAAARACRCNEFDRFGRLPRGICRAREPDCETEGDRATAQRPIYRRPAVLSKLKFKWCRRTANLPQVNAFGFQ